MCAFPDFGFAIEADGVVRNLSLESDAWTAARQFVCS
jgi:hypothetical protein